MANLQDELTGALIGLARSLNGAGKVEQKTSDLVIRSLFATLTNVNFNEASIKEMIAAVQQEKNSLKPGCRSCANPCGMTENLRLDSIWRAEENIRSLKSLVLFGLRGMAAYAYHAMVLGFRNEEVNYFFMKALFLLGEELTVEELLPLVDEVGEKNLLCLELLDRANTESYGNPQPTEVPLKIEKGPFIVITGHDLKDLELLQYDILYGDQYVYNGKPPITEGHMQMGIKEVTLTDLVENLDETYSLYGTNFTKWSKVYINDENQESTFLNNTRIELPDSKLKDGDIITVSQVGSSNTIFRTSREYIYMDGKILEYTDEVKEQKNSAKTDGDQQKTENAGQSGEQQDQNNKEEKSGQQ